MTLKADQELPDKFWESRGRESGDGTGYWWEMVSSFALRVNAEPWFALPDRSCSHRDCHLS